MAKNTGPETLLEAVQYFADKDVALQFVAALKWPNGVSCPACASANVLFMQSRRLWKCRECKKQFSAKVGTIFEDSPIGLEKWMPAVWLIVNAKNGISSYELGKALGVTQKTAWFMLHRIRLAMQMKSFGKMAGTVEVDETYIGGRARNMHKDKRARVKGGRNTYGKTVVMGLLERHSKGASKVRFEMLSELSKRVVQGHVRKHIELGSEVNTDAFFSYQGLDTDYAHGVIDHAEAYVDGTVHTNGLENFWSLLKRAIKGTYVSVEPFHLFRYLDEQAYRFNNRKDSDLGRFVAAVQGIVGKRLTYASLTGTEEARC
jgi:transposase-like protein